MDTVERIAKERRIYPRIKENTFIFCRFKGKSKIIEAITKNISGGGLMFESEESILPNRTMQVELYEPLTTRVKTLMSIFTRAKVVWVKKLEEPDTGEGSNKFKIGVRFSTIGEQDRDCIVAYVKRKLRQRYNY